MNVSETLSVLLVAAQFDARLMPADSQQRVAKATAWNSALDVRMEQEWAQYTVVEAYARDPGLALTPAHLNREFLAQVQRLDERGTRPRLPRPAPRVEPETPALPPTGQPVPPTAGYLAAKDALLAGRTDEVRDRALAVKCPHCQANPGERCTVQGKPLVKSPAHPARVAAVYSQA